MTKAKKLLVGITASALAVAGTGYWAISNRVFAPAYQAAEIIDGDTFKTTERQTIRLVSIQAPETGDCYASESAAALSKLIIAKKLYIKVIFTDSYRRLVSLVYTDSYSVNKKMIESGAAYFENGYDYDRFNDAMASARDKKLGIFSPLCRQQTNSANPKCVIKANIDTYAKLPPLYRFPGCGQYDNTLVDLAHGDRWFCTEKEAIKNGFTKASDCFSRTWP